METDRITMDPEVMAGQPCIRGLRFPVVSVLRMVAVGMSPREILAEHPDLEAEDIPAALTYAGLAMPISPEDVASLEETLDILSDEDTMASLRASAADIEAGHVYTLTKDEARQLFKRANDRRDRLSRTDRGTAHRPGNSAAQLERSPGTSPGVFPSCPIR